MSAIEELLSAYQAHVKRPWDPTLAGQQRVWFAIYDPPQERRLRARIGEFEAVTVKAGHAWRHLDLTDAFETWMANHEYRDAYFEDPDLMGYELSTFAEVLAERVREALTASDVTESTVVAISGLASLFGLTRVSALIDAVNRDIRGRLLAFFPGHYDEQSYFRLLDARDGWDYLAVPILAR